MDRTEGEIKKDIICYLKKSGFYVWNNPNITHGRKKNQVLIGVADILGIHKDGSGRLIALEVKKPGGRISTKQDEFLSTINLNGGIAGIVRSIDDTKSLLAL
jgi:hypothetical protein